MASDDAGRRHVAAPDLLWGARADRAAPAHTANGADRAPPVADDPWSEVWPEPEPEPAPDPTWPGVAGPPGPTAERHGYAAPQGVAEQPVVRAPGSASVPPAPQVAPALPPEASAARRARRRGTAGERAEWVLHRVRVWSVAKLAFCVYLFLFAVVLGASAVLWWVAASAGLVHNVEKFLRDIGFTDFHFHGRQLFEGEAIVGGVAVVAFTLLTALAMAVVNVISELSGGLRLVITERKRKPPRRSRRRRNRPT